MIQQPNYIYLVIAFPLLVNIFAVVLYRGLFRVLAIGFLVPIGFATVVDGYSASQDGNLTGIFTICVSGPSLVGLLVVGLVNAFVRVPLSLKGKSSQSIEPDSAEW